MRRVVPSLSCLLRNSFHKAFISPAITFQLSFSTICIIDTTIPAWAWFINDLVIIGHSFDQFESSILGLGGHGGCGV